MREALDKELEALNAKVESALAERKAWMDAHMEDYAKLKIGEEIYDLESGQRLGIVRGFYRYSAEHNPLYDTSMSVEYEIETRPGCIDNTSRNGGYTPYLFGSREEAKRRFEQRAKALA